MEIVHDEISTVREKISSLKIRLEQLEKLQDKLFEHRTAVTLTTATTTTTATTPESTTSKEVVTSSNTNNQTKNGCCKTSSSNHGDDNDNDDTLLLIEQVVRMLAYNYFTSLRQCMAHFPQLLSNRTFWMQFLLLSSRTIRDGKIIVIRYLDFPDVFFSSSLIYYGLSNDDDDNNIDERGQEQKGKQQQQQIVVPLYLKQDDIELMVLACSYDMRVYERLVDISNNNNNNDNGKNHHIALFLLRNDESVIQAALNCSPLCLLYIDSYGQRMYPYLMVQALSKLPLYVEELQNELKYHIDSSLWRNRNIVLTWIRRGGKFLMNQFPDSFRDDPEILLANIQHQTAITTTPLSPSSSSSSRTNNSTTIDSSIIRNRINNNNSIPSFPSSQRLRCNKEFMIQALGLNGRLLSSINSKELINDFDIILTAFSDLDTMVYFGNNYCTLKWMQQRCSSTSNDNINYEYLASFAKMVKSKLRDYDNFITILCAISLAHKIDNNNSGYYKNDDNINNASSFCNENDHGNSNDDDTKSITQKTKNPTDKSDSTCLLPVFDQGDSHSYAKTIAQYIDVPTGKQLRLLRKAYENLSLWGLQ